MKRHGVVLEDMHTRERICRRAEHRAMRCCVPAVKAAQPHGGVADDKRTACMRRISAQSHKKWHSFTHDYVHTTSRRAGGEDGEAARP